MCPKGLVEGSCRIRNKRANYCKHSRVILSKYGEPHHNRTREAFRQPCIRGLRITVWDVLNWPADGMTEQQILDDYPELEPDDFRAVYEYAARLGRRVAL